MPAKKRSIETTASLIAVCLGLMAAVVFIIGFWIVTGSLEAVETLYAGAVFLLIIGGMALLARTGRMALAAQRR